MTRSPAETVIGTPRGPGRLVVSAASASRLTLLVSHGAGAGIDTRDLTALTQGLPALGITVAAFEQPWRVAGRRVASPPGTLDEGFRAAAAALPGLGLPTPLVVGGRSAGARSAARTARELGAVGCLALAFPLHPPGRPERSRRDELAGSGVPTLVVQGEHDSMGRPDELTALKLAHVTVSPIASADHGLKVPARAMVSQEETLSAVVRLVADWLDRW